MKSGQIGPTFNAIVRSKYIYGLPFVRLREEMMAEERSSTDGAMKELLQTRTGLNITARRRLAEILPWDELALLIEK